MGSARGQARPGRHRQGAKSLLRVAANVDTDRHGKPAFLAVVTGWGYAYRRPDGVFVIPVGTLGS